MKHFETTRAAFSSLYLFGRNRTLICSLYTYMTASSKFSAMSIYFAGNVNLRHYKMYRLTGFPSRHFLRILTLPVRFHHQHNIQPLSPFQCHSPQDFILLLYFCLSLRRSVSTLPFVHLPPFVQLP